MKGRYPRFQYWCSGCDMQLISPGTKCKHCGTRDKSPKLKRPTDYDLKKSLENTDG